MSKEDLPSIDDYIVDLNDLPSVEDYLTEEVKTELPSVEDYIEEEEIEEAVQTIEDAEGNTFAEVKDIIPPFPELIRLINDVRKDIPDIPEIKYYDKELENLTEQINQVRDEIPEVRYYETEIETICKQIDLVKEVIEKNAADIPEIKYYDDQISILEQRLEQVNQNIEELPEPKYYEEDIQSLRIAVQEVQDQIPTFPKWVNEVNEVPDFSWIGKTFSVIDDDFVKVHDAVEGLRGKVEYDLDRIEEHFDKKEFETRTEFNELRESINTRFDTEKEKIWKEIKETSMRMWGHHKEFKDDDRKLKKQLLGEYNLLKQTLKKDLKEVNKESVKTDELLLGYFNDLKKEISELPEVKYYDKQISVIRDEFKEGLRSLKIIVEEIRGKQEVLKEEINNRPVQPDPSESNIDPLTPTDQNFATHEDLAKHYKLFINRIQQQLYTIGGGGAGFVKDLADVDVTGLADNYILQYDSASSKWLTVENSTDPTAAQSLVLDARNNNVGYAITIGTPVYQSGFNSGQDRINIEESRASDSSTMPAKGLTASTLDNNTNGRIIVYGELEGVDTSAFDVADELYIAPGGGLTNTRPTGDNDLVQKIAVVLKKSASNGALLVYGAGRTNDVPNTISISGNITAADATFSGNVSVAGTITYDDVTYVDSIGIATARSGLEIGAGSQTTIIKLEAATATTTTTSESNIDTFSASIFRSAQYQIQITQGTSYQVTTLNLLHNGTNVYLSEFGTIKTTSDSLATFDADINSGNVRVRATPSSSSSTIFKISKTLTKV